MTPGVTNFPAAFITTAPAGAVTVRPTAAIFPSTIRSWPSGMISPAAVITVAPRIRVGREAKGRYVEGKGLGIVSAAASARTGAVAGRAAPPDAQPTAPSNRHAERA